MTNQQTSCGACAFFDDHHLNGGSAARNQGLCRFNPPVSQPGPDSHGLWPVVAEEDWCGHFKGDRAGALQAAE